jgi:hypothetical protein
LTRTLYHVTPTYDALGNVIETVTTLPQGTDTQVFCADDLSRLSWAGSTGTPACADAPTPSDTSGLVGAGRAGERQLQLRRAQPASPLGACSYRASSHGMMPAWDASTAIG